MKKSFFTMTEMLVVVVVILILAAIGRPIHTSAHNTCFADEFDELYEIEKLKDRMYQ